MLLYLFDFRKVLFEGASKSSTAFFTVQSVGERNPESKVNLGMKSPKITPGLYTGFNLRGILFTDNLDREVDKLNVSPHVQRYLLFALL
jgi:hypothetical protein